MTQLTQDADGTIRQDGQTPEEWLTAQFEYEYCAECGYDAPKHQVILSPLNHFFALCLEPLPDDLEDDQIEAELARRRNSCEEIEQ